MAQLKDETINYEKYPTFTKLSDTSIKNYIKMKNDKDYPYELAIRYFAATIAYLKKAAKLGNEQAKRDLEICMQAQKKMTQNIEKR